MTPEGPGDILVLIVDAGGGHRSAANALLAAANEVAFPFPLRVVSLQEVFKDVDVVRGLGINSEQAYNFLIQKRLTRALTLLLKVLHGVIRLRYRVLRRAMERYLRARPPRLVVSLAPNFNAVVRDAVRGALPNVPFVIALTDFADFPPHFWIEPGVDLAIVATDEAVSQALAQGLPKDRIAKVSGMALNPRFYRVDRDASRRSLRGELGIPDSKETILVLFGGKGSAEVEPLCARLLAESPDWHVIAICGDNPALESRLRRLAEGSAGRLHGLGFTQRVPEFMAASDLLLTKPGPGSLAEALHLSLPLIVVSGAYTVPQERFNARLVEEKGFGRVVGHWKALPAAARELLRSGEAERIRSRLEALPKNGAVFEILETLASRVLPS